MNQKEARAEIARLASSGIARSEIYARLSGRGIKDRKLAWLLASYADPRLLEANQKYIGWVVLIACAQTAMGFIDGFGIGEKISVGAGWLVGVATIAFGLLFAWGFYRNKVGAYNAYLLAAIIQLPFQLDDLAGSPLGGTVEVAIGLALLGYVWWVRNRIFPDFAFMSPRKANRAYVFSD